MSNPSESSYYEIALTNRQVMTVFVVLLVTLVAAFFAGVWIGQKGSLALDERLVEAPLPVNGAADLAELNFFSEGPSGGAAAAEPPRRAAPPPRQPAEPPATPPAAEAPAATPPEAGPPQPTGSASEPPRARPASEPPPATAPGNAADASGPVIQVFSTADVGQARRLVQRLAQGGFPVFLLEDELQGQRMYRVRVGPYGKEAEAQQVAERLRRDYRLDTWITEQPG